MRTKVYPDTGPVAERGHCFGGAAGIPVWAWDALDFLRGPLAAGAAME